MINTVMYAAASIRNPMTVTNNSLKLRGPAALTGLSSAGRRHRMRGSVSHVTTSRASCHAERP